MLPAWSGSTVNAHGAVQVVHGDLPADLAIALRAAPRIAWDVETTGLDWRRERLATCQLFADGLGVVLVRVGDVKPAQLAGLLEESTVEKVFHHAPFDLRFMVHAWNVQPVSIRCTKVASKLLEPSAPNKAHSLQKLVARHLGISLPKGPVRTSDWTAATLTAEQIDYAADDASHLLDLLDILQGALAEARLTPLYDDCCAFLPARVTLELADYPDVFAY
jgi:ribonuclease D